MLGEDNSDLINVHPALSSVSSPRLCVREQANAGVRNLESSKHFNSKSTETQMQLSSLHEVCVIRVEIS